MDVSVAFAHNEAEAEMICGRLLGAGIAASYKRMRGADLPQLGGAGAREIYVNDADEARARETLATPEFTDEELAELADRSAPPDDA
jgi:Putative prokaryotic signal transducing protein